MNRLDKLMSAVGPVIVRYVDLKRALGGRAETMEHILAQVDRFLGHAVDLTRVLFFTLNREDFSFVIHLDRQPRTSRRREAQTGSRARSGSRSERTLDAVEHSRTLMEWWPFLIFHRGGLRIKVINNTRETFAAWCSSIKPLAASTRRQRMRTVYHLCLFRQRSEPTCFVPDPSQFPPRQPRPRPHIFSEDEITQLLLAADDLTSSPLSPLRPQVCQLAVVLLYTTGLRRGEIVGLRLSDYTADECVLLVRESKFYKSRLIPLSDDAAGELDRYLKQRRQLGFSCDADSPLLFHNHGGLTGYTGPGFGQLMRRLFRATSIRNLAGRSPRVHDLRFTFAVHALLRWYRADVDVQARLPALSTYMGHASIVSTQYYLTFVDAIAEAAGERYHKHCSRFLPKGSFERGAR